MSSRKDEGGGMGSLVSASKRSSSVGMKFSGGMVEAECSVFILKRFLLYKLSVQKSVQESVQESVHNGKSLRLTKP